jgi:hypothetical protein
MVQSDRATNKNRKNYIMFKSILSAVALFAATSTVALAACPNGVITASNDYITPANRFVAGASELAPGVVVRTDGKSTFYEMGEHGLNRSVLNDECGKGAIAWAQEALGVDVTYLDPIGQGDN